jgi:hypothetical protein
MATSNSNCNTCGCTDTYVVTTPCPPSCPEVFNAQCIVYTGTDVVCNQTTVISRYDYLDTVITKLVNFICNTNAPVTVVVGSTYIDVVPNTVGNVTTYTVSVDIPALQAYFDVIISQTIAASILAGPGINVAANPITGAVTISHADTSSVANISSDNTGNTFIQDVFFTFDTFGHVTGASVVPASIIEASLTSAGGTESLVNDGVGPALATKGLTAGTGITLSSTATAVTITNSAPDVPVVLTAGAGISTSGTYPNFTITNTDTGSAVTLADAGTTTHESLVNDGTGPTLATKGLKAGTGISLSSTGTDITIRTTLNKYSTPTVLPGAGSVTITHNLGTLDVVVAVSGDGLPPLNGLVPGVDYTYTITSSNTIDVNDAAFGGGAIRVTVIG